MRTGFGGGGRLAAGPSAWDRMHGFSDEVHGSFAGFFRPNPAENPVGVGTGFALRHVGQGGGAAQGGSARRPSMELCVHEGDGCRSRPRFARAESDDERGPLAHAHALRARGRPRG